MKRALFLDRDGILNEVIFRDGQPASPRSPGEFRLLPGAREVVEAARERGFLTIVVTNQPDIGRGLMNAEDLAEMHRRLAAALPLDGIEVATAGEDTDPRRKPNPGMLLEAAARHDLELSASWILGDSAKDLGAGRQAGVGTILLETAYNLAIHGQGNRNFRSLNMVATFLRTL